MPLLAPDGVVGALVVRRREPGEFPKNTIDLMQTFAAQSVLAIQNARLFSEIGEKGQQLEVASQHKSQFLANMSHELRTPLNAVLGYTELILDSIYGEVPEKARATLERIQSNGRHLLGLINDVLDLSKIEAGQLTLSLADYSIKDVVHNVYGAVESLATSKNLALKVELPKDLPPAHGDERRLTQVLLNLVGNAIKFTDTGEVAIRTSVANGTYTVAVHDTGPGIAEQDQGKIFEEFQQADFLDHQAERRHRARACDRQAHHRDARRPALGRVRAGARIDVLVHGAGQRRTTGRTLMSGCILVVEDQMDNRQILRDLLGNAGYQLVEAENGEEALAAVAKQRPDLILMDIQLPVMDGYEATRRIRANPDFKSIPIIAVTSYALAGDEAKALAAGCNAYVTKPYSPRQLLAKVREFLPS